MKYYPNMLQSHTLTFLAAFAILFLISCQKDETAPDDKPEEILLPPTEFSFEYDGNTFIADTAYWRNDSSGRISFFASDSTGSSLYIQFRSFSGVGDYGFDFGNFDSGNIKFIRISEDDTITYRVLDSQLVDLESGQLTVESTTTNPVSYSGKFNFRVLDLETDADSITLKFGSFNFLREHDFDLQAEPGSISYWFDGQLFTTTNYKASVLGSNLIHLELFDERLPLENKLRIVWPIEYQEDELLFTSDVTLAGNIEPLYLYPPCPGVERIYFTDLSEDDLIVTAKISVSQIDCELELNNIELERPFMHLAAGEAFFREIFSENQVLFDQVECVRQDGIYYLEARNDQNNLLTIETIGEYTADYSFLGYDNFCISQFNAKFEFHQVEGNGPVTGSHGFFRIDQSPITDEFSSLSFSSEYFDFPGSPNQIVFAADSIQIQY